MITKTVSKFDDQPISIYTVNLFNQRTPPIQSQVNWKGDWLLRRERLSLVDQAFERNRPDLIIVQEAMARQGSPSESDIHILSFGSLEKYQWSLSIVHSYPDTEENEMLAIAAGPPISLDPTQALIHSDKLGVNGSYSLYKASIKEKGLWILNVDMPKSSQELDVWYKVLSRALREIQLREMFCNQRLVVSGYLPGNSTWPHYQDFLNQFELKNTSLGFCDEDQECSTTLKDNPLYNLTLKDNEEEGQVDRILVHRDSLVQKSGPSLNRPMRRKSLKTQKYGFDTIWPTRRSAWSSLVLLPSCQKN